MTATWRGNDLYVHVHDLEDFDLDYIIFFYPTFSWFYSYLRPTLSVTFGHNAIMENGTFIEKGGAEKERGGEREIEDVVLWRKCWSKQAH